MANKRSTKKAGATSKRGAKGLRPKALSSDQAKRVKGGGKKSGGSGGGTVAGGWDLAHNKTV